MNGEMTARSGSLTLAEFINARLSDDEAGARMMMQREADLLQPRAEFFGSRVGERVLRQVTAMRAILADLDLSYPDEEHLHRLLATIWADHEQYDESWRP